MIDMSTATLTEIAMLQTMIPCILHRRMSELIMFVLPRLWKVKLIKLLLVTATDGQLVWRGLEVRIKEISQLHIDSLTQFCPALANDDMATRR